LRYVEKTCRLLYKTCLICLLAWYLYLKNIWILMFLPSYQCPFGLLKWTYLPSIWASFFSGVLRECLTWCNKSTILMKNVFECIYGFCKACCLLFYDTQGGPWWTSPHQCTIHRKPVITQLWMNLNWLIFGFILVTDSVGNRSHI
jgi:hypothetical protein